MEFGGRENIFVINKLKNFAQPIQKYRNFNPFTLMGRDEKEKLLSRNKEMSEISL